MSDSANNKTAIAQAVVAQPAAQLWRVVWEFGVHAFVGTLIFGIIAGFAVGLELAVRMLRSYGTGSLILFGLEAAEYALFGVDLLLFGVYLFRTARRTIKQL
jgi:hypothetical protein